MSNNLNEHKINKQFTDKAWANMQTRLDKAMPVSKGWGAIKWLILGIVCLLFTAGYWLINHAANKNKANTTTLTKFVETKDNEASKTKTPITPKTPNLLNENSDATVQLASKDVSNLNKKNKLVKPVKKAETTYKAINKKEAFVPKNNNFEKPFTNKKKVETLRSIAGFDNSISTKKKSTYVSHITTNSTTKPSNLNVNTRKKASTKAINNVKSNELSNTIIEATYTKPSAIFTQKAANKKFNSAKQVNNIKQINRSISKSKDDIQLISKPKINQSKPSSVSQKLLPQNQDGRFAHKTINYGIKLGLSSDLTSESGFKAGALVDFNFSNKFYLEFCTSYHYSAINKKIKVQYETIETKRVENPIYTNPGESIPSYEGTGYTDKDVLVKDTINTIYKTNQHNVDLDLMLAYKITQNLQALIGMSATKKFTKSGDNNFLQSNLVYNEQNNNPYTTLEFGPKIALRFKLKDHLFLETSYKYNLQPIVETEFQVKSDSKTAFKNPYRSKKLGLGFVYKF